MVPSNGHLVQKMERVHNSTILRRDCRFALTEQLQYRDLHARVYVREELTKPLQECVTAIAIMNAIIVVTPKSGMRIVDAARSKAAMRLTCIPGMRPVNVPARMPMLIPRMSSYMYVV
jgi:hypothetical protein